MYHLLSCLTCLRKYLPLYRHFSYFKSRGGSCQKVCEALTFSWTIFILDLALNYIDKL